MKIQVNTDRNVEGTEDLVMAVHASVGSGLERFEDRLTRVEVHLSDRDSANRDTGDDMQCRLEARPMGMQPVVVTGSAASIERALHDATRKMVRLLTSTFGRIDGRDARGSIRQPEGS